MPHPDFLLGQALVELGVALVLRRQLVVATAQEGVVVAGPVAQSSPVQFEDAPRLAAQELPVVRDEDHGAVEAPQEFIEAADGRDVEVVGRFVEQQHVRVDGQRPRQQHATTPAGGHVRRVLLRCDTDQRQGAFGLVRRSAHHVDGGARQCRRNLLGQQGDAQAGFAHQFTRVGHFLVRKQPQQRGLTLAVASEQTDALAALDAQIHAVEHGGTTEGQGHRFESETRPVLSAVRSVRAAGRHRAS